MNGRWEAYSARLGHERTESVRRYNEVGGQCLSRTNDIVLTKRAATVTDEFVHSVNRTINAL